MKTIGDLRSAILENGGELKIGGIIFTYVLGEDIDAKDENSNILFWYGSSNDDESLLKNEANFNVDTDFKDFKKLIRDLKKDRDSLNRQIDSLKLEIEEYKNKVNEEPYLKGKIEVLEKMVKGRDLIISANRSI